MINGIGNTYADVVAREQSLIAVSVEPVGDQVAVNEWGWDVLGLVVASERPGMADLSGYLV